MRDDQVTLRSLLNAAGPPSGQVVFGATASADLGDLAGGTSLGGALADLRGRSVLVATRGQLEALLAMVELDGVARRLVLCPPGLPAAHLAHAAAVAEVDALVSDQEAPWAGALSLGCRAQGGARITPDGSAGSRLGGTCRTEWVLLTSGTTGLPKLVAHTLATLTGAIRAAPGGAAVWSTFYDIRRYGGLQIALRALLGGGPLVLSDAEEATGDFLARAGSRGVTHISGTPSHWRRALMSPLAQAISPQYARLSGEVADQAILDQLRAAYPRAKVAHAFASTEAGVAFDVGDGRAGFPADLVGRPGAAVEMRVEGGSLRIRSARTALRYLAPEDGALVGEDGFVDTGDMVELREGRYHFAGRRGGIINVGGAKVHPEEVEAVINQHPGVRMSLVSARRSPVTGAIVTAEIVAAPGHDAAETLKAEVLAACRSALAPHKVPAVIRLVPALGVTASGKLARPNA